MLAGAAMWGEGKWGGGGRVMLLDVDTERLLGLKYKLVCHFELAADVDRPAFLERELMGLGVDGYW